MLYQVLLGLLNGVPLRMNSCKSFLVKDGVEDGIGNMECKPDQLRALGLANSRIKLLEGTPLQYFRQSCTLPC